MGFTLNINGTEIAVASHSESPAVYNVLVDVVRIAKTNTALGFTEVPTVVVPNMPAHIKFLSGQSKILFNKDTWLLDAIMRCRTADILVTDRILYNGDYFEIQDIVDVNNLGKLMLVSLKRIES